MNRRLGSLTRRQWIAAFGAAATTAVGGTALNAFAIEPKRVEVTRHTLGASGGRVVRIVQLSDLHLQQIGAHEARIADAAASARPDLILITGDAIDRADALPLIDRFLAMLPRDTTKLAITGNWEFWGHVDLNDLTRIYDAHRCRLLRNESMTLTFDGAPLLVTGIDSLVGGTPNVRESFRNASPNRNHLLLAHCPEHRDTFRADAGNAVDPAFLNPQALLAGHTHGGQIAPFGLALLTPPGSGRYVKGWYRDPGIPMYVSRGLGTSMVHARLGNIPEVAVFEWTLSVI